MGTTIRTFPKAIRTTLSNPVLLPLTFGVTLFALFLTFVLGFIPFFGQFLAYATFTTLTAGIIGVIGLTIKNKNSQTLNSYTTTLSDRAPSVFSVALVENIILFIFALITAFLGFFVLAFTGAIAPDPSTQSPDQLNAVLGGASIITIFFGLFVFLSYVTLLMIFQFLTPSIVLGNKNFSSAFGASLNIVKTHPISVIGYTIARFSFLVISLIITGIIITTTTFISEDIALIILLPILTLAFILSTTIFYAYHTHYYLALHSTPTDLPNTPNPDTNTDSNSETNNTNSDVTMVDPPTQETPHTESDTDTDTDTDTETNPNTETDTGADVDIDTDDNSNNQPSDETLTTHETENETKDSGFEFDGDVKEN